ncbi:unnamed protein product [Adineta ricciae]|uniref:Ubiquitin-like domain-containing protein n=1 Tax=Adineta ricciae TaxID=249248 RepID=A0A816DCF0_ADIRI|nr:unnamed protein product [Adineta ricciae]
MSFIEGIGDDFLYALIFLLFLGIVSFSWLSTHVNNIHSPPTLFVIERRSRRRNDEESETISPTSSPNLNEQLPNEILTEHDSDVEASDVDDFFAERAPMPPVNLIQTSTNLNESVSQSSFIEGEDQSLQITIKFLNETQKLITVNSNDTISKVKRLHFLDELANNKIVRFIYQGRELQDSETLRSYNIRDQTVIHCQISPRRHSTPNRINDGEISHSNAFDTSSFLDTSPISISTHLILFLTVILGSVWYLRIKYRVLFTPISTIILIFLTVIFLIFTCGPALTSRRQISDRTSSNHVHLD